MNPKYARERTPEEGGGGKRRTLPNGGKMMPPKKGLKGKERRNKGKGNRIVE